MVRVPTDREPTHPGEMLLNEFLLPLNMTQRDLANAIHVPYQRVNEVVRGNRGVTPSTALRLSRYFGTSPGFWMNLQLRWDLYRAQRAEGEQIERIRPHELVDADHPERWSDPEEKVRAELWAELIYKYDYPPERTAATRASFRRGLRPDMEG